MLSLKYLGKDKEFKSINFVRQKIASGKNLVDKEFLKSEIIFILYNFCVNFL